MHDDAGVDLFTLFAAILFVILTLTHTKSRFGALLILASAAVLLDTPWAHSLTKREGWIDRLLQGKTEL